VFYVRDVERDCFIIPILFSEGERNISENFAS